MACLSLLAHQAQALDWLTAREEAHPRGGILADEPGMGKTVMTIALMTKHRVARTLVIAPKSVAPQWLLEIRRFSDLSAEMFDRQTDRPLLLPEVCIMPYSVLMEFRKRKRDAGATPPLHWARSVPWDRVVIDEAHNMKNPRSQIARGAMALEAGSKFALTGTPIQNTRSDLITLANWIGYGLSPRAGATTVRDICNSIVLRRTMEDVPDAFTLPKLHMRVIPVDLSPEERLIYDSVEDYARQQVAKGLVNNDQMAVLEAILRCRQLCSHPQVFIDGMRKKFSVDLELANFDEDLIAEDWDDDNTKSVALCDAIESHPGEKAIVFCSFVQEMRIHQRLLEARGIKSVMFHGGLNNDARMDVLERFRGEPETAVLLAQISAGGVGLNLQEASRVYILSPQWNPMWEVQGLGRSYRHGQTREVHFVRLVARSTIEERICEIQERKLALISSALDDPRIAQKMASTNMGLTKGDVKYMFRRKAT